MQEHPKTITFLVVIWMWLVLSEALDGKFGTLLPRYLVFPIGFLVLYFFLLWCFSRGELSTTPVETNIKTFLVSTVVMWLIAFVIYTFVITIELPS